eukprot:SAG25_NODE_3008_length_1270_cov_2.114432_1_plen_253_part_10
MQLARREGSGPRQRRGMSAAAALTAELGALKIWALSRRATAAGVDEGALEAAVDEGDRAAIIALIVAREVDPAEELRAELRPLKLGSLSKRAIAAGVDQDALEAAFNDLDSAAIIELIVAKTAALPAMPPHNHAHVAGGGDQGGRVAAGLGPIAPLGSLSALFSAEAQMPKVPGFLESIEPIAQAGTIPCVMDMAEVTLAMAKDQKQYGQLKDDPLCVEGIAFIMKYSAEDTVPPLYKDMLVVRLAIGRACVP